MTNIKSTSQFGANQMAKNEMMSLIIQSLPAEDCLLMEQKYIHKKSLKDLSKEMDISESALKMKLLRARNRTNELVNFQ